MTAYNKIVSLVNKAESNEIEHIEAINGLNAQDLIDVLFSSASAEGKGPLATGIAAIDAIEDAESLDALTYHLQAAFLVQK